MKRSKIIALVAVGVIFTTCILTCAGPTSVIDEQVKNEMQKIENEVAIDAEKQYYIAKKGGDKMQTYVQAGMVAAAYLQAKDEVNYNKWKAIEKQEEKAANNY